MDASEAVWDSPVIIVEESSHRMFEQIAGEVLTAARKYAAYIDEDKLIQAIRGDRERYERAYKEGYEAGYRKAKEDESL